MAKMAYFWTPFDPILTPFDPILTPFELDSSARDPKLTHFDPQKGQNTPKIGTFDDGPTGKMALPSYDHRNADRESAFSCPLV